ncbi:unnamed protein product [Closterium sp. NIES-64]|nr:unnamed protein product [Closterium sp. NIES-64]
MYLNAHRPDYHIQVVEIDALMHCVAQRLFGLASRGLDDSEKERKVWRPSNARLASPKSRALDGGARSSSAMPAGPAVVLGGRLIVPCFPMHAPSNVFSTCGGIGGQTHCSLFPHACSIQCLLVRPFPPSPPFPHSPPFPQWRSLFFRHACRSCGGKGEFIARHAKLPPVSTPPNAPSAKRKLLGACTPGKKLLVSNPHAERNMWFLLCLQCTRLPRVQLRLAQLDAHVDIFGLTGSKLKCPGWEDEGKKKRKKKGTRGGGGAG